MTRIPREQPDWEDLEKHREVLGLMVHPDDLEQEFSNFPALRCFQSLQSYEGHQGAFIYMGYYLLIFTISEIKLRKNYG